MPKFHSKKSLVIGVIAGIILCCIGLYSFADKQYFAGAYQILFGAVLSAHCLDMIKYYKRHRIVKIEKTDTHRIVTKE